MSEEWYVMSSNKQYLSGYESEVFDNSYDIFDDLLTESPESYPVQVNNVATDIIIQSTSDANKRVVLSRENEVSLGDLIDHKTYKWLVTELPINNRVYDKTEMTLCNNHLLIKGDPIKTKIGTDDLGRPVYDYQDQTLVDMPCVVQGDKDMYDYEQEQINIPKGSIVLHIQHTDKIKVDQKFKMLNDDYVVTGIDMSKTINNEGILIILAEKTQ